MHCLNGVMSDLSVKITSAAQLLCNTVVVKENMSKVKKLIQYLSLQLQDTKSN